VFLCAGPEASLRTTTGPSVFDPPPDLAKTIPVCLDEKPGAIHEMALR
jgi:hypothetical protein